MAVVGSSGGGELMMRPSVNVANGGRKGSDDLSEVIHLTRGYRSLNDSAILR